MWFVCFFFFKQKTAYDMRISDWSSDVCSSDLFMRVADDILADVDLFEAVLVHEHQIVALGIEELEILGVEAHLFDRVGAAKTVVELAPVDQVLGLEDRRSVV